MNILIAIDKFKGSIGAAEAARALAEGIVGNEAYHNINLHPMADGGDGTLEVLQSKLKLKRINTFTVDSIGRPIESYYLSDRGTAYIELANSSGLALLSPQEYNPMGSNTRGTGLQIKDAIEKGHQEIVLAIGGSSSTDAGTGILEALGFEFFTKGGKKIFPCGENLSKIEHFLPPDKLILTPFTILTDVKNTLWGIDGAAHTFAAQKGAKPEQIIKLDQGLKHFSSIINTPDFEIEKLTGGGAGGGVAAGLSAVLSVRIQNGFSFIANKTNLEASFEKADIIITGEGKFDETSLNGKVVGEILAMAHQLKKKLIIVCGQMEPTLDLSAFAQMTECYEILDLAKNEFDAMEQVEELLKLVGKRIAINSLKS